MSKSVKNRHHARYYLTTCLVCLFVIMSTAGDEVIDARKPKLLPIFQVVRFPNNACSASESRNGTCYTSEECLARSGTNGGTCASGFGVCCVITAGCGQTSSENCTYVQSNGGEVGQCKVEICKCHSNVCQLRLDFENFVITGPSTSSTTVAGTIFGNLNQPVTLGFVRQANTGQCLTDSFSVLNPGGIRPPSICGINTGQHMYVDADEGCNDLTFQLGGTGVGTAISNRQWSIKVSQYDCDYNNLAPEGCTQYFYGSSSQTVQSFNFDGGQHLADQNQNICVRRERGNCRICWTTQQDTDFQVSGSTAGGPRTMGTVCGGYGFFGFGSQGFEYIDIPGARTTMNSAVPAPSRICGRSGGLVTAMGNAAQTVCSQRTPFSLRFISDLYEQAATNQREAALGDDGFRLTFIQAGNC